MLDVRRDCDAEYLRRATAFIRAAGSDGRPFFVYFNHSLMHMPVIPREEFKGTTGQGDWADSLVELDADFDALLDLLDELGLGENTIVVFAEDNGPEEVLLWRGSPGYWERWYRPATSQNGARSHRPMIRAVTPSTRWSTEHVAAAWAAPSGEPVATLAGIATFERRMRLLPSLPVSVPTANVFP